MHKASVGVVELPCTNLHARFELCVCRVQRVGGAPARKRGIDMVGDERQQFLIALRVAHEWRIALYGKHPAHVIAIE